MRRVYIHRLPSMSRARSRCNNPCSSSAPSYTAHGAIECKLGRVQKWLTLPQWPAWSL